MHIFINMQNYVKQNKANYAQNQITAYTTVWGPTEHVCS